jgi:hypothetical protein
MISVAPAYNLPAAVGSATLALDALTVCCMNITHWSPSNRGNKGRLGRAGKSAAHVRPQQRE